MTCKRPTAHWFHHITTVNNHQTNQTQSLWKKLERKDACVCVQHYNNTEVRMYSQCKVNHKGDIRARTWCDQAKTWRQLNGHLTVQGGVAQNKTDRSRPLLFIWVWTRQEKKIPNIKQTFKRITALSLQKSLTLNALIAAFSGEMDEDLEKTMEIEFHHGLTLTLSAAMWEIRVNGWFQ